MTKMYPRDNNHNPVLSLVLAEKMVSVVSSLCLPSRNSVAPFVFGGNPGRRGPYFAIRPLFLSKLRVA